MIKNVIFDIGRVLVDFDWETYLDTFGFEKEKAGAIARALFAGPYWKELDRSVVTMEKQMELFVSLAPQYRKDVIRVFEGSHVCVQKRAFAIPWVQSLKERGLNVYYLSNYSPWMRSHSQDALDFIPHMDGGLFSYEVKQIKPDDDIYKSLFARYPSIRPEESVFIDDSAENIYAAQRLGMHGIIFESEQQAKSELNALLD